MHPRTAAEPGIAALPPRQGMPRTGPRLPEAGSDVMQCVVRRPGIDVAAYRVAWEHAVARHPMAHTGFAPAGGAEPGRVTPRHAVLDDHPLAPPRSEVDSEYEGHPDRTPCRAFVEWHPRVPSRRRDCRGRRQEGQS